MKENFKQDVLKKIAEVLIDYGFTVQMLNQEVAQIDTLRCGFQLPKEDTPPMVMDLTFYELDYAPILQFYIYVLDETDAKKKKELGKTVDEMNAYAPLGHMGFYGDNAQLYYRYCLLFEEEETVESASARCESTIELMFTVLQSNLEQLGL